MEDLKHIKTIRAKTQIFVVLEKGLLFVDETPATVRLEDRFVAEKAAC